MVLVEVLDFVFLLFILSLFSCGSESFYIYFLIKVRDNIVNGTVDYGSYVVLLQFYISLVMQLKYIGNIPRCMY